jgi:hypothetical protein
MHFVQIGETALGEGAQQVSNSIALTISPR